MITNPLIYLFSLAFIATALYTLEIKTSWKFFRIVPSVVLIYALSMSLASFGLFAHNDAITHIYTLTKTNLLPAMLFLMLLQVDLGHFARLGKKLLIAYVLAVVSIAVSFIVVVKLFHFPSDINAAFGALAGSWMGGTANMVAVGSALGVSEDAFAYALVVDSVNYTLWVMLLLFLVPFAHYFNRFTRSEENLSYLDGVGCACSMGAKRYWLLIGMALAVSLISQLIAQEVTFINSTTTMVLVASLLGVLGSFTSLREVGGSGEVATTMLYVIVALIGSRAVIDDVGSLGVYVFAGSAILILHAMFMLFGAKLFHLDFFSVGVASLSNIGGVASAPILAATYDKRLVSVGVLMAIVGYLIGTVGGLLVGYILQG